MSYVADFDRINEIASIVVSQGGAGDAAGNGAPGSVVATCDNGTPALLVAGDANVEVTTTPAATQATTTTTTEQPAATTTTEQPAATTTTTVASDCTVAQPATAPTASAASFVNYETPSTQVVGAVGIGIYESDGAHSFGNHPEGKNTVEFNLPGAFVLVLSSYEPNNWQLTIGPNTVIQKVYSSFLYIYCFCT